MKVRLRGIGARKARLRLELQSSTGASDQPGDSSVNEVEIFIKSGDTLTEIGKVGSDLPYSQREIRAVWAATKLNLSSTPTVLLFKVRFAILASPDHFYGIISSMSRKASSTLASFFAWFFSMCSSIFTLGKTEYFSITSFT